MKRPVSEARPASGLRLLAWICALIFILSTLPLYLISFYNHPYYDDYVFSAKVRAAWRDTRSLPRAFRTAWESARTVRAS